VVGTAGNTVNKTITIDAPTATVWQALTEPAFMQQWMAETALEIITDWTVGSPFTIRGALHGIPFENRGTVLQFVPEQHLQYTHLSSISHLPDQPESYSVIGLQLMPIVGQTALTVTVTNFPTEAIHKHLVFYWTVVLEILKRMLER
jgi:uncharacterized protein YndB with AHSA1/START domain